MITVGIDPGNQYTGVCVAHWSADGSLIRGTVERVRGLGTMVDTWQRRLLPHLLELREARLVHVGIERPPPTARRDAGHGHQAPIGEAAGFLAGLVVHECLHQGWPHYRLSVQEWRSSLLVWSAQHGLILPAPRRATKPSLARGLVARLERVDAHMHIHWRCSHVTKTADYAAMRAAIAAGCPACRSSSTVHSAAEDIRDAWKAWTCQALAYHLPDTYRALVAGAAAAARGPKPDWRYAGVADACDAFGVAVGVLARLQSPGGTRS